MNIKKDNPQKLSSEESEFLEQLLIKEQSVILNILKCKLGEMYDDLRDECVSEICWLAVHKVDVLMNCTYPDMWLATSTKYIALNA